MTTLLAAGLAAASLLTLRPAHLGARLRRPDRVRPGPAAPPDGPARPGRFGVRGAVAAGCAASAGCVIALGVVPLLAAVVVGAAVTHVVRRERAGAEQSRRSQDWQAALARLAAALRSGSTLPTALELAGDAIPAALPGRAADGTQGVAPRLRSAAAMIRLGGDPTGQLLKGGDVAPRVAPGPVPTRLAAALGLAHRLGVAPGPILVRLAEVEAAAEQGRREGQVALATVRATTRLLAVLPVAGLGLGALLGVASVHFLLTTLAGKCCLVAASMLEAAGLLWVQALVRDADDR